MQTSLYNEKLQQLPNLHQSLTFLPPTASYYFLGPNVPPRGRPYDGIFDLLLIMLFFFFFSLFFSTVVRKENLFLHFSSPSPRGYFSDGLLFSRLPQNSLHNTPCADPSTNVPLSRKKKRGKGRGGKTLEISL